MNSYRIETFLLESGVWKAAAFECGRYIGEGEAFSKAEAVSIVCGLLVEDIYESE